MSALGRRIVVAIIGIPPLLWAATSQHSAPIAVVAAVLVAGCCYEVMRAEGTHRIVAMAVSLLLAVPVAVSALSSALGAVALAGPLLFHALPLKPRAPARGITGALLWVWLPLMAVRTLTLATPDGSLFELRPTPLLIVLVAIWAADTIAFFFGSAFGKRPLAPKISPRKTVEGAAAGLTAAGAVTGLLTHIMHGTFVSGALFGASIAAAAIVGDLLESRWKRSLGIKDSGTILPGHGGFLDRFDSLLLAAPVAVLLKPLLHQLW